MMNDFFVSMMLLGALSSGGSLPFWAVSNQYGLMPEGGGALGLVQAYKPFDAGKTFQWEAGASLAASYATGSQFHPMVDELYAGARWNVLRADFGLRHREREFLGSDPLLGSLSVTEGHIIESNNARTMPGLDLALEPLVVPFTGRHLLISGHWGDYKTLDDRYVDGALVHRLRAYVTWDSRKHFYIQAGLDHYALWGGTSPKNGEMPVTLDNYLRVCTGRRASSSGSRNDQMNVIGDHGGAEQLRMGWRESAWSMVFQYEKPYSDKSGMRLNNIPDGVYTLHWSLSDKDRWISDVLLEYHYTMWQSGTIHEPEVDANGKQIDWHTNKTLNIFGGDNYFTNGEYKSGWTYYGRSICSPLFTTGTVSDVAQIVNNRFKAVHMGVSGKLFRIAPYKLMFTLSENYGTYRKPYISPSSWNSGWNWWEPDTIDRGLRQLSAAFTGYVPLRLGCRSTLDVLYGLYADAGSLLEKNFGATIGVRCTIR